MMFHIEVPTTFEPTMMATMAMGAIPTCFYCTATILPTLIFIEDAKFLNAISRNNHQPSNTFCSTCHHMEKAVANSMVNAGNHHEQWFPIDLATIQQENLTGTTHQWHNFLLLAHCLTMLSGQGPTTDRQNRPPQPWWHYLITCQPCYHLTGDCSQLHLCSSHAAMLAWSTTDTNTNSSRKESNSKLINHTSEPTMQTMLTMSRTLMTTPTVLSMMLPASQPNPLNQWLPTAQHPKIWPPPP